MATYLEEELLIGIQDSDLDDDELDTEDDSDLDVDDDLGDFDDEE